MKFITLSLKLILLVLLSQLNKNSIQLLPALKRHSKLGLRLRFFVILLWFSSSALYVRPCCRYSSWSQKTCCYYDWITWKDHSWFNGWCSKRTWSCWTCLWNISSLSWWNHSKYFKRYWYILFPYSIGCLCRCCTLQFPNYDSSLDVPIRDYMRKYLCVKAFIKSCWSCRSSYQTYSIDKSSQGCF